MAQQTFLQWYELGIALKKEELVLDDLLFGLTIKYFEAKIEIMKL